jgi:hypothetical protein
MASPQDEKRRWRLLRSSTNPHGVEHWALCCKDTTTELGDYEELAAALNDKFGAIKTGQLDGPYSTLVDFHTDDLDFTVMLDWPDEILLYARNEPDRPAMGPFVARLLNVLNGV